jgi:selenocysteine-specific elongation factor
MRTLIVGTAGHIDHGKTALVRALTGIETDRLPDEKRRGITIDLGFAHLTLGGFELGFVDVPGHEAFVRNMLAGATGFDIVLLVVAADEGIMPQTREHLAIIQLLGIARGVVALTKADLVEPEWLELVREELADTLAATVLADADIVPVSSVTGEGLDVLRGALVAAAAATPARSAEDLFRLPIDRVFTVHGTGTVVTGTVWSGRLSVEDTGRILPGGLPVRTRGLQVHGAAAAQVSAGQRAAVALAGVAHDLVRRGDVLVSHASWAPSSILTARVRLTADAAAPLRTRQRVRFHLGTVERLGRVALLEGAELAPGEQAWAQLRLEAPVIARAGDRFVIRSYSPVTTIGGGVIAEPFAPRRRDLDEQTSARLAAVLGRDPEPALPAAVALAGLPGLSVARVPLATAIGSALPAGVLERVQEAGDLLFTREAAHRARERLLAAAEAYHRKHPLRQGVSREELRNSLPRGTRPQLALWALDSLVADGALTTFAAVIRRAGFEPRLSAHQEGVKRELMAVLEQGGLAPPAIGELPLPLRNDPDLWRILKLMEHELQIVSLGPDLYISRRQLDAAVAHIRSQLAGRGGLGPADFKALIPVSRKYLIPLLEYLDGHGVTVRSGDARSVPEGEAEVYVKTPMIV